MLSEENVKKREAPLRKDNPNIDERALRERAEAGLISGAIAGSGMRTTVTDNLAHAIANELLIQRDVAQMKGASSSRELAANIGQNPTAVMAELSGSLSNLAATVMSPAVAAAAPMIDRLSKAIETFGNAVGDFNKKHPNAAIAEAPAAIAAGGSATIWGASKVFGWVKGLLGLGGGGGGAAGGAAGGGTAISPAVRASTGVLGRLGLAAGASPLMDVVGPLLLLRQAAELANPTTPAGAKYRVDTAWPSQTWDLERSMRAEREWRADPEAARGRAMMALPQQQAVSVSGEARVDHTVHLDVHVDVAPDLRAKIDSIANDSRDFTVPLQGGGSGRMDGDAGPHRRGGIGSM